MTHALLGPLLLALAPALQEPPPASPDAELLAELGEGPLDNDVFLPVAAQAELQLARGDAVYAGLLARGLPEATAADRRAWVEVLDAWHAALGAGEPSESVATRPWQGSGQLDSPWPDPDGTAGGGTTDRRVRRTESLADAVMRRVLALGPAGRLAWRERFAGLADEGLAAAGRAVAGLAQVEGRHPATPAAARAALALAELELEAGRAELARTWLERAERHAAAAAEPGLEAAVARRREIVSTALPRELERDDEAWRRATSLRFVGQVPLEDLSERRFVYRPRPGVRVQPDLAWIEGGLAAIQTEERVVVLDPRDGRRVADFAPLDLLAAVGVEVSPAEPPVEAPGWPSRPAAAQGRLVVVLRSSPPALVCVSLAAAEIFGGPFLPRLEWAVVDGRLIEPGGPAPVPLEGWPGGEVQPGPICAGGLVVVQTFASDEAASRSSAHAVALELGTGRVRWSRLVARGAPLALSSLRFLQGTGQAVGQPLARVGGRVAVGTHLGACALLELCDGRPAWSFAYRRRPGTEDRWSGATPTVLARPDGLLLAPADSDRAYWLRGGPDLAGEGVLLQPPMRIGAAEVLLGGDARRAVVLARSGRLRTLAEWDAASGERWEAPWLAPGEVFTGTGAVSPARALFASDRAVYLHDRERDLYLLEFAPFGGPFAAAGGNVVARGDRVLVLGPHMAWILEAR